ncbi:MAG: FlgD immunoglobulin-like domain containing protein [Candidatus Krumholzibacteria bacterium]
MKRITVLVIGMLSVLASTSDAGRKSRNPPFPTQDPITAGASLTSAAVDTFNLGWFSWTVAGLGNAQGWTSVDLTSQLLFFHVASGGAGELNGGTFGNLLPLVGNKSLWCGQAPSTNPLFCGWAAAPGYGNGWDQIMISNTLAGDSVKMGYKVFWDSEPGYDGTVVEYSGDGGVTWTAWPVGVGFTARPNVYDGGPQTLVEEFTAGGLGTVTLRMRFVADGARSNEDGLWPTDGAILMDSIRIETWSGGISVGTEDEDFEGAPDGAKSVGIWTATTPAPFGDFSAIYPGVTILQEDPCFTDFTHFYAWFDVPTSTNYNCHLPDPRPDIGAVPFGIPGGVYLSNEIWSPPLANTGAGNEYILSFLVYKDLPLDNLQFFTWRVRSIDALGCPSAWRDHEYVYYGGHKFWLRFTEQIGTLLDPTAPQIQIAVGTVDLCSIWCGIFGSGVCHSHAPLIDEVHVKRVNTTGPQWSIRHIDLFQDNFSTDGTITGTAGANRAEDIAPVASPTIRPGDSVTVDISNIVSDPLSGTGPAAYAYVAVWPQGQPGKAGVDIEAPETRLTTGGGPFGKRWPLVASPMLGGVQWYQFRMDTAFTAAGTVVHDRFAIDLNDNLFTPGDTICYFFAGTSPLSSGFFHRTLNGQGANNFTSDINVAANSPMEFTILPAGGVARGGDILYVDDADDRGGPTQIFFDSALDYLGIRDEVDRYDILDSSTFGGNSLASRVRNVFTQIIGPYRKILWNSGNRESGLIGDGGRVAGGGGPKKADDFALLFTFLDQDDDNPGVYASGDDIAEEWALMAIGASAVNTRSIYMNFNLDPLAPLGDHKNAGEPLSPVLDGVDVWNIGEQLVAYGGCPIVNDFDLLQATGLSVAAYNNTGSGLAYVLSQTTPNSAASTARFVLSGFSYHFVRDLGPPGVTPARVTHLHNILAFLQNVTTGTAFDGAPQYANVLKPNYPNPFNPTTKIEYSIKEAGHVSLRIYNAAGQLVRTLVNEVQTPQAGVFTARWNGMNNAGQAVASGVYFYKLVARNFTQTRKMVLLK